MLQRYLIVSIISVLTLLSCKKETGEPTAQNIIQGTAKAVIVNSINDSIRITFSGLDIATGTSPHLLNLTLLPNDTLIIPRNSLKNATRYIYTWHTNDYRFSNWFKFINGVKVKNEFDYFADTTDYNIVIDGKERDDLLICLNGTGTSSTWVAIDAYNSSGSSIWNSLNNREKTHSFVINRFHTIKHNYIDTTNNSKTSQLAFALHDSTNRFYLNTTQIDKYILSNNINFIAPIAIQAIDTLFYCGYEIDSNNNITYSQPYYKLARTSIEQ